MKAQNSFDEVRFLLAFFVLIAHTSALASAEQLEWFTRLFDSGFAVKGFFAISGYLVTKSYYSSDNLFEYFEKRVRRIYPAYLLVLIYCVLVGFITSALPFPDFILNLETLKYLLVNSAFLNFMQPTLPGALINNSMQALNGSLWTIKVELMLYFVVPFLCISYAKIGKLFTYSLGLTIGASWFVYFSEFSGSNLGDTLSRQFPGQLPFFALGSVLGFMKFTNNKTLSIIFVTIIYYFLIKSSLTAAYQEVINMLVYPLFVIAVANHNFISVGLGRVGDLSYGIYLFHFPTIQALEHFDVYKSNPYVGFFCSIILTVLLAYLSWHFVEKIFLKRSSHYIKSAAY